MDALRLEARLLRQAAQDQEGTGAGQRAAPGVQEDLGAMSAVKERPAAAQVAAERVGGAPSERDDPLLVALSDRADESFLQVDAVLLEADRLAHTQAGAVQELDERAVAQIARRSPVGRLHEALCLSGRERAGERPGAPRQAHVGSRVVPALPDQHLVAE